MRSSTGGDDGGPLVWDRVRRRRFGSCGRAELGAGVGRGQSKAAARAKPGCRVGDAGKAQDEGRTMTRMKVTMADTPRIAGQADEPGLAALGFIRAPRRRWRLAGLDRDLPQVEPPSASTAGLT